VNQPSPAERNQKQEDAAAANQPLQAPRAPDTAETTPAAATEVRRPLRADAARNVQRLILAAREAFAEHGAEASLDDIARRAGVGPGTLYRHFPNRGTLLEAVYLDGVRNLCAEGDRLLETEPPADALIDWLRAFSAYVSGKRGLAKSLLESVDNRDQIFRQSHEMINRTGNALLDRAKAAGAIRPDLELMDAIRLANAIALACEQSPEGPALSRKLLNLALDGLRPRAD
jgi:AcrR family transcriptional regulator